MIAQIKIDVEYKACLDHEHVKITRIEKPSQLSEKAIIYAALMSLDYFSNNYLETAQPCDKEKRSFKIAKQVSSFTKYLTLENDYKKYDCEVH